jgi:hypothetical protein
MAKVERSGRGPTALANNALNTGSFFVMPKTLSHF